MLDQNTDRMWYVIGAIVIGAAIIAMGLNIFSDSFDSVEENFGSMMTLATSNMGGHIGDPVYSDEEVRGLIDEGYLPVATAHELQSIGQGGNSVWGAGTDWEVERSSYDIKQSLGAKYVQVKDIDLSEIDNFEPIGTFGHELGVYERIFYGAYDGGGYSISNLRIDLPETNNVGLFGGIYRANIKHTHVVNSHVKGFKHVGGLVGIALHSEIRESSNHGSIRGVESITGGLVGWNGRSGLISDSKSSGSVSAPMKIGGLVGENGYQNGGIIQNSYTNASVRGQSKIGAFVGLNRNQTDQGGEHIGMIKNSYYDASRFDKGVDFGEIGEPLESMTLTGLSSSDMKRKDSFNGWSEDIWLLKDGSYPTFK